MLRLAICNTAERAGKTTTTIQLGAALGLCGLRTLLIDLDPAAHLSKRMGLLETAPNASSAILFDQDFDPNELLPYSFKAFDLLPADRDLRTSAISLTQPTDVFWVKEALQGVRGYEVVMLDTGSGFRPLMLNAMVAADTVLIPMNKAIHSVESGEQTWKIGREVKSRLNPDLLSAYFLFTFTRFSTSDVALSRIREKYTTQVLDSTVCSSVVLALDLEVIGKSVYDINPRARGAVDYANVADELLGRLNLAKSPEYQSDDTLF